MTDVEIGTVDTTIEFEPEVITASPAAGGGSAAGAGMSGSDIAQLRAILRPIILDLMAEEYDTLRRMTG